MRSPRWSAYSVPLRLLPAAFDGKGGIARGELGIAFAVGPRLGAFLHQPLAVSSMLQPQVIAVMQNTKSARLMSGPVSSLLSGAPSTHRA